MPSGMRCASAAPKRDSALPILHEWSVRDSHESHHACRTRSREGKRPEEGKRHRRSSVGSRPLGGIDDEDVERRGGGFELEAELLLHGREDGRAAVERPRNSSFP
jgi:hypothetical protein